MIPLGGMHALSLELRHEMWPCKTWYLLPSQLSWTSLEIRSKPLFFLGHVRLPFFSQRLSGLLVCFGKTSSTMASWLTNLIGRVFAPLWKPRPKMKNSTKFFGSQIGSKSVVNYSYTDMPWKLLAADIYSFLTFSWAIPYVLLPITPADSGELDELSPTRQNIFCIVIHFILCVLQLAFILLLPLALLFPVWTVALAAALFALVNYGFCSLLNGKSTEYHSDPQYAAELPEHAHEQWIFINGVAVGYVGVLAP